MFKFSWAATAVLAGALASTANATGSFRDRDDPAVVREWNLLAEGVIPASAGPTQPRTYAMMHIAMFDAVNSIAHRYTSFTGIRDVSETASMPAALAQAAHDTLVELYPSQTHHCDQLLADALAAIPDGEAEAQGIATGRRAARAILRVTANDGSQQTDPVVGVDYIPGNQPGEWQPDPISGIRVALGAHWGSVRPLVMESAVAHRVPAPPALSSGEYTLAFKEARWFGGDVTTTATLRTYDQTMMGLYWAYDGTPSLCAPPRLYNQMVMHLADKMGVTDTVEMARLLALVNVTMADAGIAAWESKYYWKFWRPITAIRQGDADGNPQTEGDESFAPLGAPATNLQGPNFTPPFPAYPSGHATFGGAVFQVLRYVFQTDNLAFTFTSDELNGSTLDNRGVPRPLFPRTFATLSQAEEENAQSRIYLGIHWSFDKTAGIAQGRSIADEIVSKVALPR
jgi:membrane-associated phospholipid phosphatase